MKLVAAVDIGNSTTEVCLAEIDENGKMKFLSSALSFTTGLKGTTDNVTGILSALNQATANISEKVENISAIRINEAAPVIGGAAMETITETIVTESSMIGHNPKTPGGYGAKYGETIYIDNLKNADTSKDYIVVVPSKYGFEEAANIINQAEQINIVGAILQLLIARLGLHKYENIAALADDQYTFENVTFSMKPQIGVSCLPAVPKGEFVCEGQVIARPCEDGLGLPVHASIRGEIVEANERHIKIKGA